MQRISPSGGKFIGVVDRECALVKEDEPIDDLLGSAAVQGPKDYSSPIAGGDVFFDLETGDLPKTIVACGR